MHSHVIGKMRLIGGAYHLIWLVLQTVQHAQRTRAHGTLVVPQWPSVAYWPVLFPDGTTETWFIREVHILHKMDVKIYSGRHSANLFSNIPNTNVLALRVNFFVADRPDVNIPEECMGRSCPK